MVKPVDVIFGGRNKQVNEQLLPQGSLAELKNAWMDDTGSLRLRNGVDRLGDDLSHNVSGLVTRGAELLALPGAGTTLTKRYDPDSDAWEVVSNVAGQRVYRADALPVFGADPGDFIDADGTPNGSFVCVVTSNQSSIVGLTIRVFNTETGALHFETDITLAAINPGAKVVGLSNTEFGVVVSTSTNDINLYRVTSVGTSPSLSTVNQIVTNQSGTAGKKGLQVRRISATAFYMFYVTTGGSGNPNISRVTNTGTISYGHTWTPPSTTAPTNPINVFFRSDGSEIWAFYNANGTWYCQTLDDTGAAINAVAGATITYPAGWAVPPSGLGNVVCQPSGSGVLAIYDAFDTTPTTTNTEVGLCDLFISELGVAATAGPREHGSCIYSNTIVRSDSPTADALFYRTRVYDFSDADTVQDDFGTLVFGAIDEVRFFVEEHAGGWLPNGDVKKAWGTYDLTDDRGSTLYQRTASPSIDYDDDQAQAEYGVATARFNEDGSAVATAPTQVEANGVAYFSNGGQLFLSDGSDVKPAGFSRRPRAPDLTPVNTGGGLTNLAVYNVVLVFHFKDAQGNEYFSPPSPPTLVTLGAADNAIQVRGWTQGESGQYSVLVYRTLENTNNYHLAATVTAVYVNTVGDFLTVISDADTVVATRPPIYTAGGEQENILPEAPYLLAADGEFIYSVPSTDRRTLMVTKRVRRTNGAEFSLNRRFRVAEGGDITGVGFMDGRVILFKRSQARYLVGEPPNLIGQGGFSTSRLVSREFGARDWRGVVSLGSEILFQSFKGWRTVDRGMNVKYAGEGVKDQEGLAVARAVVDDQEELVRVVLVGSGVMVWDRHHRQWSLWEYSGSAQSLVDGVATPGDWVVATKGLNDIHSEGAASATPYSDDSGVSGIVAELRTGPLKLGSILGWGRVHELALLGKTAENSVVTTITWETIVSYNSQTTQEALLSSQPSDAITGSGAVADQPFIVRANPETQQCVTMQQRVRWGSDGAGEPLRLTGYAASVTVEDGISRLDQDGTF